MNTVRPELKVAVVMRRERITGAMSRWQSWRWGPAEVLADEGAFGEMSRLLYKDDNEERWLHPGYSVELFGDDAEGYYLNASAEAPCWFVLWRMDEPTDAAVEALARPVMVSLSYADAARWLDAQGSVEQLAAPPEVVDWLRAFVAEYPVNEPKRRRRPQSFRSLDDRFSEPSGPDANKIPGDSHG